MLQDTREKLKQQNETLKGNVTASQIECADVEIIEEKVEKLKQQSELLQGKVNAIDNESTDKETKMQNVLREMEQKLNYL